MLELAVHLVTLPRGQVPLVGLLEVKPLSVEQSMRPVFTGLSETFMIKVSICVVI